MKCFRFEIMKNKSGASPGACLHATTARILRKMKNENTFMAGIIQIDQYGAFQNVVFKNFIIAVNLGLGTYQDVKIYKIHICATFSHA